MQSLKRQVKILGISLLLSVLIFSHIVEGATNTSTQASITIDAGTVLRNVNRKNLGFNTDHQFFYDSAGNLDAERVALAKTIVNNTPMISGTVEQDKIINLIKALSGDVIIGHIGIGCPGIDTPNRAAQVVQDNINKGYNIKYYEIGNEPFWDKFGPCENNGDAYSAAQYANLVVNYSRAMKSVDPSIKIIAAIKEGNTLTSSNESDKANKIKWNPTVLDIVKNDIDAVNAHFYLPNGPSNLGDYEATAEEFYQALGATATKEWKRLVGEIEVLVKQKIPNRAIEIVTYEWNAIFGRNYKGWPPQYPYVLKNSLMKDLYLASVLNYLLRESQITMALNFNFNQSKFISNGADFFSSLQYYNSQYIKKTSFPLFELYSARLGSNDMVVDTRVVTPTYDIHLPQTFSWSPGYFYHILKDIIGVPYLDVLATKSSDGKKIYLTVVNWNKDNSLSTQINLNGFTPQPNANVFTLNAGNKSLTPTQAIQESREYGALHLNSQTYYNENNIKIYSSSIVNAASTFTYSFEPHSVTVIELFAESSGTPPKADLNSDLKVDIKDIQLCVRVILGIETDLKIIQRAKEVALPLDKADIKDIQGIVKIILGG